MRMTRKMSMVIVLAGLLAAIGVMKDEAMARERGRRHHGPPPEAYTACEGKAVGDAAEFTSPRGETVTGTCEQEGERLVLRPDNPPGGRRGDHPED